MDGYLNQALHGTPLSKGFDIACADLNIAQRYVVYPGTERFPLRYGAQAIGLVELMKLLAAGRRWTISSLLL